MVWTGLSGTWVLQQPSENPWSAFTSTDVCMLSGHVLYQALQHVHVIILLSAWFFFYLKSLLCHNYFYAAHSSFTMNLFMASDLWVKVWNRALSPITLYPNETECITALLPLLSGSRICFSKLWSKWSRAGSIVFPLFWRGGVRVRGYVPRSHMSNECCNHKHVAKCGSEAGSLRQC